MMGTTLTMHQPSVHSLGSRPAGLYMILAGFTPSDISQDEADALIAIYDATGGDSWTTNTGWKSDTTVGNWHGVTVTGGAVTALDLSNNNLSTTAAKVSGLDLSDLSSLTDIDLSDNGFSQAVVDAWLGIIDSAGVTNGTLDISGTDSAPSSTGVDAILSLVDNGWTVTRSTIATVTTGTFKMATADGAAALQCSDLDISGYDDNYILVTDGSDNQAWAYGYQADDAEALDTAVLEDDMADDDTTDWDLTDCTLTFDTDHYVVERTAYSQVLRSSMNAQEGVLYKTVFTAKDGTDTDVPIQIRFGGTASSTAAQSTGNTYTDLSFYLTAGLSSNVAFEVKFDIDTNGNTCLLKGISVYPVTALGTDALQLRSTSDGSTRNLTGSDASFDPNDISKVEVFDA